MTFEEKIHAFVTYHTIGCEACYCIQCGYFHTNHFPAHARGHDFQPRLCSCGRDAFVKELLEMQL